MRDHIIQALGGRAAEELVFGDVTTGAANDLEKVTKTARQMVTDYGMSEELGPITYGTHHGPVFLGRDFAEERNYSEDAAQKIDAAVRRIVEECHQRARQITEEHRDKLDVLVEALLEQETLTQEEIESLVQYGRLPDQDQQKEKAAVAEEGPAPQVETESARPAPRVLPGPVPDAP